MPSDIEKAFPTRQRPSRSINQVAPRRPSRLEVWAWSPIMAYRVGLTLGYIWLIYLGVAAFFSGSPTFDLTAPEGWTPVWAVALVLFAITASVGSTIDHRRFHQIELVGSWGLTILLGVYAASITFLAYVADDTAKVMAAAAYVGIFFPPALRMLWLMAQLGRKPMAIPASVANTGQRQGNPGV